MQVNRGIIVPSSSVQVLNAQGGMGPAWMRWANILVAPAAPIQPVTPTGSPFEFTAAATGSLFISGGTVSGISFTRASTTIAVAPTAATIPMANNDVVEVTYTGSPIFNFVPS